MAGPPPLLRHDRLTLEQLGAMAREFDQLSAEDRRPWPATDFVLWPRDEYRASVAYADSGRHFAVDEAA